MNFFKSKVSKPRIEPKEDIKDRYHKSSKRILNIFYSKQFEICHFAVAKNASSVLRPWIYSLDDLTYEEENALYGPRTIQLSISEYRLRFPNYFLFTCVRNPFSRLISCYLDKFVQFSFIDGQHVQKNVDDIVAFQSNIRKIKNVEHYAQNNLGSTQDGGLTFEQFLHSIEPNWPPSKTDNDGLCDSHWASQFDLIALKELGYDAILRCENLLIEMEALQECTGIPISKHVKGRRNETRGSKAKNSSMGYICNITAAELSRTGVAKNAADMNFYTQETIDLVISKYNKDMSVFGYLPPELNY